MNSLVDKVNLAPLANFTSALAAAKIDGKMVIVSDSIVAPLYAAALPSAPTFIIPAGENYKTLATYTALIEFLSKQSLNRADALIALGGGVVGDLAGFAAATYLRGIKLVQVPTTLLAMVDSAIGGKTAVNLPTGKNLLGTFYQPHLTFVDVATLNTLPAANFADGTAEIIKYAMLGDAELFAQLAAGKLRDNLAEIIARCIKHKQQIVAQDERDEGVRQHLNFGHTLGHAIEKKSNYQITHGHAVASGMAEITRYAVRINFCPGEVLEKLLAVLEQYALPTASPLPLAQLITTMYLDKKRRGDKITLVLPRKIGECELYPVAVSELVSAFS